MPDAKKIIASLFSTRGTIGRRRFAYTLLIYIAVNYALQYLAPYAAHLAGTTGLLIVFLLFILTIAAALCQMIRRYHDFGRSGWWPAGCLLLALATGIARTILIPRSNDATLLNTLEIAATVISGLGLVVMVLIPLFVPGRPIGNDTPASNPHQAPKK